ncbi:ComF family protein [Flavobacterium terrigena]|uniref:ComF family protein n=1 Tax=Flavobacterium terrigena TaxID=402734 RepID=A0A1H6TU38_9FLAO|nr:phosphoribosyltransferase family protein [Flavobacterium terrigena]SEI83541.1 comF family protein [Flavobacterium terrigena]
MLKIFDEIPRNLLNVLFPVFCNGCSNLLLKNENVICTKCLHNLPLTHHHTITETEIDKAFYGLVPFEFAASFLYFTKKGISQNLIHNLKYKNRQEIGTFLGNLYADELKNLEIFQEIDFIIPVPLHTKRFHERGYNQVTTFCKAIEKNLTIPMLEDVLLKTKNLKSVTDKSKESRLENNKNVFSIENQGKIEGKHVLIIDDVFTTGATIEACAKEILKIKNTKISILTMAYSQS